MCLYTPPQNTQAPPLLIKLLHRSYQARLALRPATRLPTDNTQTLDICHQPLWSTLQRTHGRTMHCSMNVKAARVPHPKL